jgi:hypothetical protein
MYAMRQALPSGEPEVNRDGLPTTLECYLRGPERTLG